MSIGRCVLLLVVTGSLFGSVSAQQLDGLNATAIPQSFVRYVPEPQVVPAGKKTLVKLRFELREGFHINSHTPKSDLLLPTVFLVESAEGVRLEDPQYPSGSEYSFSFDPKEKLEVYTGSFTVTLPVSAKPGDHTIHAALRYQACDQAACYPPRSLPVSIILATR